MEQHTQEQQHRAERAVLVAVQLPNRPDVGPLLRELEELAKRECPPGAVVFAGRQEKIAECISIADEIVSGNMVKPESFGLSVAEALAMEKPVRLLKRFGGAAEILDDVAASGKPSTREAVRELYGFEAMKEKTLAVYREVAR